MALGLAGNSLARGLIIAVPFGYHGTRQEKITFASAGVTRALPMFDNFCVAFAVTFFARRFNSAHHPAPVYVPVSLCFTSVSFLISSKRGVGVCQPNTLLQTFALHCVQIAHHLAHLKFAGDGYERHRH